MEPIIIEQPHSSNGLSVVVNNSRQSDASAFITANTLECSLEEIRRDHIIPVFLKDNEPVISHTDFVEVATSVVEDIYHQETILKPAIRVSHPIKGRVPEARNKPASELKDYERTLYYERMAFVIEVPSIADEVGGNLLSLTIGGVKAYNLDNLHNRKGADEHFKVFIGFKNTVCLNLCIWSSGAVLDLKVKSIDHLRAAIWATIQQYNQKQHLSLMKELSQYTLNEQQFATLLGRCRMHQHLPKTLKAEVPALQLVDAQLTAVCKDYYRDSSFCKDQEGNINLWRLYNLLTGANKSTYIDSFIERSANAFQFTNNLKDALDHKIFSWYLS